MKHKGFLCVIEGADGTGKSTLMKGLISRMNDPKYLPEAPGLSKHCAKEPTCLIEEIKETPQSNWLKLTYLFIRQREIWFGGEYGRRLREETCICFQDRAYHSTCVYESLLGGIDPVQVLAAHGDWLVKPDITVILNLQDSPAEQRLRDGVKYVQQDKERRTKDTRGGFYSRIEDFEFQQQVRECYRSLTGLPGFDECVVVNADAPPEGLLDDVWHLVYNKYLFPWLAENSLLRAMGLTER